MHPEETVYPVKVVETFQVLPLEDPCKWIDAVCIWERVDETTNEFVVNKNNEETNGKLETLLLSSGLSIKKRS
jgi:hypothetical protein